MTCWRCRTRPPLLAITRAQVYRGWVPPPPLCGGCGIWQYCRWQPPRCRSAPPAPPRIAASGAYALRAAILHWFLRRYRTERRSRTGSSAAFFCAHAYAHNSRASGPLLGGSLFSKTAAFPWGRVPLSRWRHQRCLGKQGGPIRWRARTRVAKGPFRGLRATLAAGRPPGMNRRVILAAGFLVLFVGGGARFAIGLTLKPIAEELGVGRTTLGLAVAAYFAGHLRQHVPCRSARGCQVQHAPGARTPVSSSARRAWGSCACCPEPWQIFAYFRRHLRVGERYRLDHAGVADGKPRLPRIGPVSPTAL